MKRIMLCILCCSVLLAGCSTKAANNSTATKDNEKNTEVKVENDDKTSKNQDNKIKDNKGTIANPANGEGKAEEGAIKPPAKPNGDASESNISEQVKYYILYGQDDKSEAEKLHWSKSFLENEDIPALYSQYKNNGGPADNVSAFAEYITHNAPVLQNWEDLFKKDLKEAYGYDVSRLEDMGDNMYQAYVKIDGKEVPYVGVNSRTGYYHG